MTDRTLIADLAPLEDGPVAVAGWVETVRDQKKVQFVVLRDESGALQLVRPRPEGDDAISTAISGLALGSFVRVEGLLKHDERVKLGGIEVRVDALEVVSASLAEQPIAADSSIDKRLDHRFLDLRNPVNALVFKVQTTFEHALRVWLVQHGYLEIHTPKLMNSPSESRAELFQVPYFETTAYLAQSPQHFKQMAQAAGFGKVFEIADAFRADPSFTARHATEFTSIDVELSWIDGVEDVMAVEEAMLVAGIEAVREAHGDEIERLLGITVEVPSRPFPRIPLARAKEIVAERGYTVPRADADMDPEGERRISDYVREEFGHDFVFLTDYAASIRPFYHQRHADDPSLTSSYDLIYRGTEITTGAQREHRVDVLLTQIVDKGLDPAELDDYLEFFRYGMPPHGGFAIGLARVLMLMLERSSIRETTYLFRGPNRLKP